MIRNMVRFAGQAFLLLAVAVAAAWGQEEAAVPEKHVRQLRAEQPREMQWASPLCQKVLASGQASYRRVTVDPATLETSLQALMEKSDEVVVTNFMGYTASVISPSGEDVITYMEGRVVRSLKGTHKPGDLVTLAGPQGGIACGPEETSLGVDKLLWPPDQWGTDRTPALPLLFLRRSRAGEDDLPQGSLRLAGNGVQGYFALPTSPGFGPNAVALCEGTDASRRKRCNAALDEDTMRIRFGYKSDPLKKMYERATVSQFLQEVQALADRSGYGQAPEQK
jgi:hypothetical protein